MARKKEFDRDEVLEKAMETFWCQGYEATSVQDLVEQMGINRGSLYDTFGDKRALFLAAIAHYNETAFAEAIAQLEAPGASKQAIVDYFQNFIECATSDKQRRGCLMTNSAVELAPHDQNTASCITTHLQRLENAFYHVLVNASEKGEISSRQDLRALARFLTCVLQGLHVMCKVKPSALQDITDVVIAVLE
ncbi:TetR/AcrR family transcriptional regulator [Gloeocapsopsis dulcis]|uniref:TetR family transcriptional regulator n=1 Tax=Gloeocapsopsis dulcis AAB1 = 1H9 TaxID=1433147 RepID=A0A6N8FZ07_9CHRO|nr:TetR/AcrR family transcriptional regulator [Gloeocapsopsis dulcis]MUL37565.1 TetR family transcriptional regulator [Gloeocapsopsis dulcis AAB1 = 1H9]WNN87978.1 TetR/AcrR family transcriptional regulator [Gloeocapsopsis dulcis]